jgi:hypothetical protein
MKQPDGTDEAATYEIQFLGRLEVELSAWLGGRSQVSEVIDGDPPLTRLTVRVPDQAALRGVLNRLWDLNVTLTSVRRVGPVPDKEKDDER